MRAIFISYRRSDSQGEAGRLFDDLVSHFGEQKVFMDVAGIEAGRDFRKAIEESVANCGVLLVLIGPTWASAKDESGIRRLDDPADFVREEVAAALRRDISVIPVLVRDAEMPRAEQLPDCLTELAYRNCVELTHARWKSDVQLLVEPLRRLIGSSGQTESATKAGASPPRQPSSEHRTALQFDASTLQRITKELAMDIGPIAEVVVKRAAPYCASDEALCMKVAEEIESEQQREKFLKRVASTLSMPLVTAASSSKSRQAPVVVKTPEVSSASNKAIDQPKSSGRRKVLVPVFVGIAAIALAGIALVGLRKRSSERDVLAPAAVSLPENGKPEEPSRAPSQELTTANRPAETPGLSRTNANVVSESLHRVRLTAQAAHELLSNEIAPSYPPLARQAHVQGAVVLEVNISTDGAVESLKTVSGHPMLIPAAIDAVKQWRYRPYLVNGVPAPVETTVTVSFNLLNG